MITKYKLTIAIDDVNPSPKYRILGTVVEPWLRDLHLTFGCKFTLFIPSCYHGKWPIGANRTWVNELVDCGMFELAAHGHFHQTSNPKLYGECEFLEIGSYEAKERMLQLENEWATCNYMPIGWRNPGWLINPSNVNTIENSFEYVALHYEHNNNLAWNECKTFFGHDGIQVSNINVHNTDMFMFTSHIAGNHNHNVWSLENYEQFKLSLEYLFGKFDLEPKFLKECL